MELPLFDRPPRSAEPSAPPEVLSVAQFTAIIKDTLETTIAPVWVAGEISNLAQPQSGHIYFTLKDDAAQIRAVLWRSAAQRVRFRLADGLEVLCRGALDVYPPRGQYQLVIREIEPRGEGALQLALRQLQARLAAEGLFDPERKRPLPAFPRRVAFVTSPTGAAIRDFLEVLRRRWPGLEVLIVPARVQGEGAAAEIAAGVRLAGRLRPAPEVIVVGRGGGSLEDLWCFNEEAVVRAVAASPIPTISAVGHEIDITLCDLAADVRALTPSEAAERLTPKLADVLALLASQQARLATALANNAQRARAALLALARRRTLARPLDALRLRARRLDELEARLARGVGQRRLSARRELAAWAARLAALSPLAVLGRGYSVTQRLSDGAVLRDAGEAAVGETLRTRLARGELISRVEQSIAAADPPAESP